MTYNRLFTLHGVVMVFLFMIPAIPSVFGNFLLPLMIGAKDVAFPRLNLASFYIYLAGAVARAVGHDRRRRRHRLDVLHALQHAPRRRRWRRCCSASSSSASRSILTGLNFIVTMHTLRAPGMTWIKMPLFVWAHLRHQRHPGAGHAGARPGAAAGARRARCSASACSTRRAAATRCSSSTCSGSTRTRPSTSWCCRPWA